MIPPLALPIVRRAILDLLEEIGGEHNHDTLTLQLRSLGHRVAARDVAEQLLWLAGWSMPRRWVPIPSRAYSPTAAMSRPAS